MDPREEANPLKKEKLDKLRRLRELGIDPYPHKWSGSEKRSSAARIKQDFKGLKAGEKPEKKVFIAGRLMRKRDMGKAAFFNIQDQSGQLQCYIKKEDFSPPLKNKAAAKADSWDIWKLSGIGDILGADGKMFRTKKGELSLRIEKIDMLCKSLEALPEKYHGLEDKELKYRLRHLDLIMDSKSRGIFQTRSKVIKAIRSFMEKKDFMEVETPVLQPIYGGAAAAPFETYFRRLNQKMYLKISPEIYLKKLVAGGFEKVYEIGKNFRNEGIDRSHNPEFLMLEYYEAYTDYEDQMKQFEELVCHTARESVFPKDIQKKPIKFPYQGRELDLSPPWLRMSVKNHEDMITRFFYLTENISANDSNEAPAKFHCQGEYLDPKRFWEKILNRFKEERARSKETQTKEAKSGAKPQKIRSQKFNFPKFWRQILSESEKLSQEKNRQRKKQNLKDSLSSDAGREYEKNLNSCKKLLQYAKSLNPKGDFQKWNREINQFQEELSPTRDDFEGICAKMQNILDELSLTACELTVEKYFWDPVFITDFPLAGSPLTKTHRKTPRLVERFEPYIAGMEIGNAYTELNDPLEQRKRLESQNRWSSGAESASSLSQKGKQEGKKDGQAPPHPADESFLHALEIGMPPTGGAGLGVERLVMLLTNQPSVRDSMLFPALRSNQNKNFSV